MAEVNLLRSYPKSKRDISTRLAKKTSEVRKIARKFDKDFFDGDRLYGYGGFNYHPRFWQPVIPDFQKQYSLTSESSILDVGCAKGFMIHDFKELIPGVSISGIDVSSYARHNALPDVKKYIKIANAKKLPFPDKSFDLVISINTIHNLPLAQCKQALKEIQRVTKKHAFITVDAYKNSEEKKMMFAWNLTAKTVLSVDNWKKLFNEVGYTGDYYWFMP